ncbi:hypothetical protein RSAG8_10801, partial [Rhizoctonia solani AG-8 WAC10335]
MTWVNWGDFTWVTFHSGSFPSHQLSLSELYTTFCTADGEEFNHKHIEIAAIASKDVPALSRLIRVALKQEVSVTEIVRRIKAAGESLYNVKSFSIREHDIAALASLTGGPRLVRALNIGMGLPGLSTTHCNMDCPRIRLSIYAPNLLDISNNISSVFRPIHNSNTDATSAISPPTRKRLWSILIDEVAIERRPRYDSSSDSIAGICRDHASKFDLNAVSSRGLEGIRAIQAALEAGHCHRAKEATVIAIAGFGAEAHIYAARMIALSGTCKAESEEAGYLLMVCTVDGWNLSPHGLVMYGPISSLETDGDPKQRRIFHRYCIRAKLLPTSKLYPALGSLPLFNTFCGPDEITHDGDFKHEEKHFATALRSKDGIMVANTLISSGHIRLLVASLPGETLASVTPLFDVTDHQNVPNANRLLCLVYQASQLPDIVLAPEHQSFVILGELLHSFTQPFTNPTLSLSQQLTHLSTCAHLLFALYRLNGGAFISGQLYYDVQTTIKTAYFTVAKSQEIDPEGPVYLLQTGTDRLEQRFATMWTMTHDRNMDIVQLADRAEAAQYVDEIYARNPDLYQGSYRLSLDGNTGIDHTNPASWTGDVTASGAGIRSCWSTGQERASQILSRGQAVFCFDEAQLQQQLQESSRSQSTDPDCEIDMMHPFGSYVGINADTIINEALPDTDPSTTMGNEDLLDEQPEPVDLIPSLSDEDLSLEDLLPPPHGEDPAETLANSTVTKKGWIDVEGKPVHAESLIRCCLGFDEGAKSTDRLHRIIGLTRSPYKPSLNTDRILGTDQLLGQLVLSFIRIDNAPAAAILRVTSITLGGGNSVEGIPHSNFQDSTIKLGGQVVSLILDPETNCWVWNQSPNCQWEVLPSAAKSNSNKPTTSAFSQPHSSKQSSIVHIPAILAIPINPAAHTQATGIWAFEDAPLRILVAQLWTILSNSPDSQNQIPVRHGTTTFPYCDVDGQRCFLQEEGQSLSTEAAPDSSWPCYICCKDFKLREMRKHVSTHLLARQFNIPDPTAVLAVL